MTQEQFTEITEWQNATFGQATALSKVAHLAQEVIELNDALHKEDEPNVGPEFADCFILLFGAAASHGMDYNDILNEIEWKMEINKQRKWGTPDANGVVNHIKE